MSRRHDLDWVRVCAFGVLVLYHVGMYYVSWDWHVKSAAAGPALEPLMLFSAPWRLSLLFLVSGVATAFMLGKGSNSFIGPRSWRLLVPLVFGMLVIVVPQAYYEVLDSRIPGGYHDGYLAFWGRYLRGDGSFCDDDGCLDLPTWNHLWFVAYLWVYTVVLWALVRLAPRVVATLTATAAQCLAGFAVLVVPALYLGLVRLGLLSHFPSTHGLFDDWYNHAQYFPVFVLGFLVAHADGVWERLRATRWLSLGIAVAAHAAIAVYFSLYRGEVTPTETLRGAQRLVWGIAQWSAIAAILGFARQINPPDSPALRYLAEAVFPVYILHQTLIIVFAWHLKPLGMPPLLEGPLLVVATFAACFAAYEIIRRIDFLRPLFGLKRRDRSVGVARPASV